MPYPLDQETAAAVEAAKQHHVIPWEVLEEGEDISQWVIDSYLANGKTALPDGVYGMINGAKPTYLDVPPDAEVKDLFETAEDYQMFLAGEDYSYGLAEAPDAEFDEHYEAIVFAIKGHGKEGIVVNLPTVPHRFLQEAPLVEGDWIDSYIVELAEWGARLVEKGLLLEESDNHPVAWQRIINPEDGSEADDTVTTKLWQQTKKHLAGFPGRSRVIDARQHLSFSDYLKWRGRRAKSDLKCELQTGILISPWNQWVEKNGGEGRAPLAGVKVGKLNCYLDGYQYRICRNDEELTEEINRRESILEFLQVDKPGCIDEERFRQRVEHWKESVVGFLPEILILHGAFSSINKRYFEGQEPLFPEVAEGFDQLLASSEIIIAIYNEALAGDIEGLECLSAETGNGQDGTRLTIDLEGLTNSGQDIVRDQVSYMVDMAKADALDVLGENRQAFELVDRHV